MKHDYDLVCIGSGPSGQRAAVQAAKLGKRVAIVERQRVVGGVCVATGTIPSKTFREAVLALSGRHTLEYGQDTSSRTRPTAEMLFQRVGTVIQREMRVIEEQLSRNRVDFFRGEASFQDPHTLVVRTGEQIRELTTDNVFVAVGTRPAPPQGLTPDGEVVVLSDGVLDLRELPRSMAVVGAGVIGIEYASMFGQLGIEVTLVDARQRPLEFLDHEIIDELIHQMRNNNVTFRLGETVAQVNVRDSTPRKGVLVLESGKRIVADVILFSVGRIGATASLDLPAAGLEADPRGRLEVDEHFRTRVPHVYAGGDVIGFPALAATSSEQGRLAVRTMFGVQTDPMAAHFPIGIYSIPEASMVGPTEEELTKQKVPYETGIARYREIARGSILGDDTGFFKMLFHRETRKLLAVHVVGTGATELIHTGQAVIALGGDLDYFLETVFNYPTLAECYKVAALDAANKLAL